MIAVGRVTALLRKEIAELSRNRSALLPVVVVGLITTALPFFVAIVGPRLSGHALSADTDLLRSVTSASSELPGVYQLSDEGAVQAFIFSRFLVMTLLVPVTGAITFAGHSLVGEKLGRSLEPLLATPITTAELMLAKVIGALLPSLAIMALTVGVYLTGVGIFAEPGVLRTLLSPKTALLVLSLGPLTSAVALQVGVIVSARVNDPRTAQQFGALFILPLTGSLHGADVRRLRAEPRPRAPHLARPGDRVGAAAAVRDRDLRAGDDLDEVEVTCAGRMLGCRSRRHRIVNRLLRAHL